MQNPLLLFENEGRESLESPSYEFSSRHSSKMYITASSITYVKSQTRVPRFLIRSPLCAHTSRYAALRPDSAPFISLVTALVDEGSWGYITNIDFVERRVCCDMT